MARELAAAERGAVYARIGTCTQEFGTLASWLVDVLNVLTGNLDREGGAMFPRAAAGQRTRPGAGGGGTRRRASGAGTAACAGCRSVRRAAGVGASPRRSRRRARARSARSSRSPATRLVSTPNSGRLERAVEGLDFMLSIDIYVNETTRHADVILPAPEPLEKSHYDLAFYQLSARNIANYSPPSSSATGPAEWEVCMRLAGVIAGQGPNADVDAFDDMVIQTLIQREVGDAARRVAGREPAELLEALEPRRGPERVLDFMLRAGPYGDGSGPTRRA